MDEQIVWQTAKEYSSDLAAFLADLLLVRKDMEFVIRATELALAIPTTCAEKGEPGRPDDLVLRTSLWHAALVAYAGCFGTGARHRLSSEAMFASLGEKTEEFTKAHDYFIHVRNKYVGHSVNRFEEAKVALLLGDGVHTPRKVVGVGPMMVRVALEKDQNVRTLRAVANVILAQVAAQVVEVGNAVLAEAEGLSEAALESLPDLGFQLPVAPSEAGRTRK